MEDSPATIREALEDTVPEVSDEPTDQPAVEQDTAPDAQQPLDLGDSTSDSGRDQKGRFKSRQKSAEPVAEARPEIQPGPKSEPRSEPKASYDRAPASWRPEIREHWNSLPSEVRAEVARRELDVQRAMQESATTRQMVDQFNQVIAPYEMFIRAENSNPLAAIDNLMGTAARLRTATAPELAQLFTGMINQFGIGRFGNQFIEQLDGALSGNVQRVDPAQQQLQAAIQQQLAPVQNFMQQLSFAQQAQQQQTYAAASNEVEEFIQQTEFGPDVRADMADLMEMAARRGRQMSLAEAYQQACISNPEILSVLKKRSSGQASSAAKRARSAAVSVSGAPAPSAPDEDSNDVRSAIEAAIAQNSR